MLPFHQTPFEHELPKICYFCSRKYSRSIFGTIVFLNNKEIKLKKKSIPFSLLFCLDFVHQQNKNKILQKKFFLNANEIAIAFISFFFFLICLQLRKTSFLFVFFFCLFLFYRFLDYYKHFSLSFDCSCLS